MKKSLIALAVAGAFAAPAFAASGNVDVYGKLRVSLSYINPDCSGCDSYWSVDDETSRIGFKGSEDLGGGLKAIWQIEQALSGNHESSANGYNEGMGSGSLADRNTFVGLSGDFGTALIGRHDTPYKLAGSADVFADTLADAQNKYGIIGAQSYHSGVSFDLRAANAVAYISPVFSGVTIAAAIIPAGPGNSDLAGAYSLAALYANGPLTASLAYEDHNKVTYQSTEDAVKLNLGYKIGDFGLGGTVERQKIDSSSVPGWGSTRTNWLLSATYGMGPMTLAAQYGSRGDSSFQSGGYNDSLKRWTVGAVYALSKRTNVAVAYNDDNNKVDPDVSAFTMQLNHDF